MKRLVLAAVVLLLLLEGCSKPEAPASHASSEPAQQPAPPQAAHPPTQASPNSQASPPVPATADQAAALQAQAEQLVLMQLMQMQQQIAAQNINRLGEIGAAASEQIYQQGIVNGCYLQSNCAVRTVTVPAY